MFSDPWSEANRPLFGKTDGPGGVYGAVARWRKGWDKSPNVLTDRQQFHGRSATCGRETNRPVRAQC